MTAQAANPGEYPLLVSLLATRIKQTDRATYDPPVGLSFAAKCALVAQGNRLWELAEGLGWQDAVRTRIALAGPALLARADELAVA